jgi:hypothetical protein
VSSFRIIEYRREADQTRSALAWDDHWGRSFLNFYSK